MTSPSSLPAAGAAAGTPSPLQPDQVARVLQAIDGLHIGLEAARLALDMARDAPLRLHGEPTAAQVIEAWRVNTALMHGAVDSLYYDGRLAIDSIKAMLGQV